MELASSGPKSQSNGGNNEVEGKVGGGSDGVEEEVGAEEENSKIDESCKSNNKDKGNLLYSIQKGADGQFGAMLALTGPTSPCNCGDNAIKMAFLARHWHLQALNHNPIEGTMRSRGKLGEGVMGWRRK